MTRFGYPISLDLEGRACVVFGGGEIAEPKVLSLLEASAAVTVVSPSLTPELRERARRGDFVHIDRTYLPGDLEGVSLAIAATGDTAVNARIFEEAERRRVLLNAVDDVKHCHFAAPSVIRRGDLAIAISTAGKAPALAKRLRVELEERFGPEHGELVDLLAEVRAEVIDSRTVDFETWARRWQHALDQELVELIRAGRHDEAKAIVRRCLTQDPGPRDPAPRNRDQPARRGAGRVSLVGAGPGDPGLLTVRGKEVLERADVIVYDRLVHPSLIEGKPALYVGKQAGTHCLDQSEINRLIIRLARRGRHVVRLKGGDPFVFGRGAEEARALMEAGIDFEIVPGVSAATGASAAAGIALTDRESSSSILFVSGHRRAGRRQEWRERARAADTLVLFMALSNIEEIVAELIAGGLDPSTPAAVIKNGTLDDQTVVRCEAGALPRRVRDDDIRSPALIVIGRVAANDHELLSVASQASGSAIDFPHVLWG